MSPLSEFVDEALVTDLRAALDQGEFPGIEFEQAMEFLLTDGIVPESGLPVSSLLRLEDWVRKHSPKGPTSAAAVEGG